MGKTKEMLIGMQEEIAMNTLSEPVQTLDIEALTDDLYNLMVGRYQTGSLRDLLDEVLADHGIT